MTIKQIQNVEMKEDSPSEDVIQRKRKPVARVVESSSAESQESEESEEEVITRRSKKRGFKESSLGKYEQQLAGTDDTAKREKNAVEPSSGITPAMDKLSLRKSGRGVPEPTKDLSPPKQDSEPTENDVAEDLLDGCTIVLTGVFEIIGREKLEMFINSHGGRCTGSVSGKTTHLVIGVKLEDGREVTQGNKYRTAKAKGTKIVTEEQFEQMVRQMSGNEKFTLSMRKAGLMD